MHHPEIYYLRAKPDSKNESPEQRELARRTLQRWDNGVVEPEPILLDAWLTKGTLDESTGQMTYDLMFDPSGTAPAARMALPSYLSW
jgi:glycosyltransferase A (GT-A) superfamily protein (DUF2064 family)